jgi:hypothetical protein
MYLVRVRRGTLVSPSVTETEKQIKSNEARVNFRELLDDAERGKFTGSGGGNDPVVAWVISDEWCKKARLCLNERPGTPRRRAASEALRRFRDVLDDAEKRGVATVIGRWNGPPVAWVVPAEWYDRAKACLAWHGYADKSAETSEEQP